MHHFAAHLRLPQKITVSQDSRRCALQRAELCTLERKRSTVHRVHRLFLARETLVSDIPAGDGKIANFFTV